MQPIEVNNRHNFGSKTESIGPFTHYHFDFFLGFNDLNQITFRSLKAEEEVLQRFFLIFFSKLPKFGNLNET